MPETCYRCGEPATYTCDVAGCGHRMCQEHSVLTMIGGPKSATSRAREDVEADAPHTDALDHAHYCLEHAPATHS